MKILIPLGTGSNWDNNELRYLLRSLELNLKDFEIVLYCTELPNWITNVNYKIIPRYYPDKALKHYQGIKQFESYFDVLNKVQEFVHDHDCGEFLFCYDDVLLLKPIENILNLYQFRMTENSYIYNSKSKWGKTVNKALELSNGEYNYEHHLPLIYNTEKIKQMFKKFTLEEQLIPYSLATTYFNLFPEESDERALSALPNYKCGFEGFDGRQFVYSQNNIEEIESAVKDKTFVNYNDSGLFWMPIEYPLQKWITKTFNKPSKYEFRP